MKYPYRNPKSLKSLASLTHRFLETSLVLTGWRGNPGFNLYGVIGMAIVSLLDSQGSTSPFAMTSNSLVYYDLDKWGTPLWCTVCSVDVKRKVRVLMKILLRRRAQEVQ